MPVPAVPAAPRRLAALPRAVTALAVAVGVAAAAAGCTGQVPDTATSPSPGVTGSAATQPDDAWGQLAGRVAAAQDRRFTATYVQKVKGRPDATLSVTIATDGTWQVTVPGGALGGTADVALTHLATGMYQCPLHPTPTCLNAGTALPAASDPRFEHVFTDWLAVLRDRQAAISVDSATPIAGSGGACWSVEPNAAALAAPVDAGVYCFDADGTLTAATIAAGTLVLTGTPVPAPATVALPGPVVPGPLLGTASPPPPPPSPSASGPGSASPSKTP